jgi:uncharacterized protein
VLEGLWHRGGKRPPLLLLSPAPDAGSMDHVVAAEAAWAVATSGHPTLRFNYRGVGASQGPRGDAKTRALDAEGALTVLEESADDAPAVVLAIGSSAEVAVVLARRRPTVCGLVFVSPVELDPAELLRVKVPIRVVLATEEGPRPALTAALAEVGGEVVVVDADRAFTRNLSHVGREVAAFVQRLSGEAV